MELFDDVNLVSHILRMVPGQVHGGAVPQSVLKLLEVLEHIKKAIPTKKKCEGPKASPTGGGSAKKRMVTFSEQIPKKSCKEAKHCALCKKHGGTQNTHNTGECCEHDEGGTLRKTFTEKSAQRNPCN